MSVLEFQFVIFAIVIVKVAYCQGMEQRLFINHQISPLPSPSPQYLNPVNYESGIQHPTSKSYLQLFPISVQKTNVQQPQYLSYRAKAIVPPQPPPPPTVTTPIGLNLNKLIRMFDLNSLQPLLAQPTMTLDEYLILSQLIATRFAKHQGGNILIPINNQLFPVRLVSTSLVAANQPLLQVKNQVIDSELSQTISQRYGAKPESGSNFRQPEYRTSASPMTSSYYSYMTRNFPKLYQFSQQNGQDDGGYTRRQMQPYRLDQQVQQLAIGRQQQKPYRPKQPDSSTNEPNTIFPLSVPAESQQQLRVATLGSIGYNFL